MMQERIDQRAVEIAGRGVDNEPRGFVDDQKMLVFENDYQGYVLRSIMRRLRFRNRETETLVSADLRRRIAQGWLQSSAADQRLEPLTRQRGYGRGERTIEAPACVGGVQLNVDRLNTPHS